MIDTTTVASHNDSPHLILLVLTIIASIGLGLFLIVYTMVYIAEEWKRYWINREIKKGWCPHCDSHITSPRHRTQCKIEYIAPCERCGSLWNENKNINQGHKKNCPKLYFLKIKW